MFCSDECAGVRSRPIDADIAHAFGEHHEREPHSGNARENGARFADRMAKAIEGYAGRVRWRK